MHYRTILFERLREACAERGIELHLLHGQASPRELTKKDEGVLPWAHKVKNRFWEVGERDLIWQPVPKALGNTDLVILMQENRILSNYPLLLSRIWSSGKVAYWGHGKNFQSDAPIGLREKWKDLFLRRVDWWFAYTEMTVQILQRAGYPEGRITCLNNAIDNDGFQRDLESISEECLNQLRIEIKADNKSRIGLFCGSLYRNKRLDFMVAAADRIHVELPDFRLFVIGDGPSASDMYAAAESRPWLRCVGARNGLEKAAYFRLANVIFNPGAVGLHVLDAFCAGIPMATTYEAQHGPEIAYLKDGRNGIITHGDSDTYARKIVSILTDHAEYDRLCFGAREAATLYTLQNMVEKFIDGMEKCLALPN